MSAPKGLLLLNTGSPDAPETGAVRRYLRRFLGDPRVIDIPAPARWLLLNLVILPFRPRKSAELYRNIWTPQGSPLLVHSRALADAVAARLGAAWQVEIGMRYGAPSVAASLAALRSRGCSRIVAMPLFPQYASSSAGSVMEAVLREAARLWNVPALTVTGPFFDDPGFIEAFAEVGRPVLEQFRPDHVLFSFHGLPERQVRRADESGGHCLSSTDCCASIGPANRGCYRAQCHETARLVAARLQLPPERTSTTFQSRLGRTPWIGPHTDETVRGLAARGVRRLAVFCPAFVADCLETLEEIGLRAREDFRAHGGEDLVLVPSLNASPAWAARVAHMARAAAAEA